MRPPRVALIVVPSILVLALMSYFALRSIVAQKSVEVAGLQRYIAIKSESVTRMATARSVLGELAGAEAEIKGYFVPQTGVVSFIDDLQARGRALSTEVSISSVSADTHGGSTLLLTLAIKGSFDAVMRTVGSIEYAPYDLSTTGLSLALDSKGQWIANMTMVVGSAPAGGTTAPSS